MQIKSIENIIDYFNQGAKKDQFIGVENEKFLFEANTNLRVNYIRIKKVETTLKLFFVIWMGRNKRR